MKSERQQKILELIGEYEIETQEELIFYLNKYGFETTQATVSRDIRELKLIKVSSSVGNYKYVGIYPLRGVKSRRRYNSFADNKNG